MYLFRYTGGTNDLKEECCVDTLSHIVIIHVLGEDLDLPQAACLRRSCETIACSKAGPCKYRPCRNRHRKRTLLEYKKINNQRSITIFGGGGGEGGIHLNAHTVEGDSNVIGATDGGIIPNLQTQIVKL